MSARRAVRSSTVDESDADDESPDVEGAYSVAPPQPANRLSEQLRLTTPRRSKIALLCGCLAGLITVLNVLSIWPLLQGPTESRVDAPATPVSEVSPPPPPAMELDLFSAPLDHVTVGPTNVFNGQGIRGRLARVGRPWRGPVDQLNDEASLINLGDYSTPKGEASLAKPRGGMRGGGGNVAGSSAASAGGATTGVGEVTRSSGGALSTSPAGSLGGSLGAAGDAGGVAAARSESRSARATAPTSGGSRATAPIGGQRRATIPINGERAKATTAISGERRAAAPIIGEPAIGVGSRQEPRGVGARLSVGLASDIQRGGGGGGGANRPVVQGGDIARGGGASGGASGGGGGSGGGGSGGKVLQGIDSARGGGGASGGAGSGGGAGKKQMQGVHQPGALVAAAEEQAAAEEDEEAFAFDDFQTGDEAVGAGAGGGQGAAAEATGTDAGLERGGSVTAGGWTSVEDGKAAASPPTDKSALPRRDVALTGREAGDIRSGETPGVQRRASSAPGSGGAAGTVAGGLGAGGVTGGATGAVTGGVTGAAAGSAGNGGGVSAGGGSAGASNGAGGTSTWTVGGGGVGAGGQAADAPVHTQVHYQGLQVPDKFKEHRLILHTSEEISVRDFCSKLREVLALASAPRLLLHSKSGSAPLILFDDRKPIGLYYSQHRDSKDGLLHVALLFEAERDESVAAAGAQANIAGGPAAALLPAGGGSATGAALHAGADAAFVAEAKERLDRPLPIEGGGPRPTGVAGKRELGAGGSGRKARSAGSPKRDEPARAARKRGGGSNGAS